MELLLQHDAFSCLPTSVAMVMGILPREIFDHFERDTGDWHPQEMIDFAHYQGRNPILLEANPKRIGGESVFPDNDKRLDFWLQRSCVIMGVMFLTNEPHAVAWDGKQVYDPGSGIAAITLDDIVMDYLLVIS